MSLPRSFWRLSVSIFLIVIVTWVALVLFGDFLATKWGLADPITRSIDVGVIIGVGAIIYYFFRNFANSLGEGFSPHFRAIFNFLIIIIVALFVFLAVLNTLQVPPTTLLIGGGILSVVIGIGVSTLFGNIITGALMLTTFPFRVGDSVIVGNVPGRILEITTFYTKVLNDSGSQTILPNAAVIQGSVPVTRLSSEGSTPTGPLGYSVGDRISTNYIGGEGTVTELTPFHMKVLLDSGKDATIPNNSIFSGAIHIARVGGQARAFTLALRVGGDAEKAIEAMKKVAKRDPSLFKSAPTILYSSLEGPVVELRVSCEVESARSGEARSSLLRAAYLASSQSTNQKGIEQ